MMLLQSNVAPPLWSQNAQSEANLSPVPEEASHASSISDNSFSRRPEVTPRNDFDKEVSSTDNNPFSKRPKDSPRNAFDDDTSSIGENPFSKRPETIPRNIFDKDTSSNGDNPFSKRPERIPMNAVDKIPESADDDSSSIAAQTTTSSTQAVVSSDPTKSSSAGLTRSRDFESWVPRNDLDQDLARKTENPSPALQKYEADRSAWESSSMLSGDEESVPTPRASTAIESTSTYTHDRGFDPNIPKYEN